MEEHKANSNDLVFALDIGTRSIVGVVGEPCGERLKVLAVESAEHGGRTMIDGQIDNIRQVAALAASVTKRLEERLNISLKRVSVAAAGRALQTQRGAFTLELPSEQVINEEIIGRLEAGAVSKAEEALQSGEEDWKQMFLVGYTVAQYRLDNYPLSVLLDHKGKKAEADVVATFLPGEVVESLYAAMRTAGLQVSSMTLEPIAAMNAAIPAELRLLNLALVDIGAGTTDIAICRGGSVVGYTMVTIAGDEITEAIMRTFLVDFATAEAMKRNMKPGEPVVYRDILGLENTISYEELFGAIQEPMDRLAQAISKQVMEVNTTAPSALFLAGGGSKLGGLLEKVAENLGMDKRRVATAGNNFNKSAFSDVLDLENPEYTTPLGIAVSAGLGLLNDSYVITLNGEPAKLFRSGVLTVRDVLLMNGYNYQDMIGRTGKNLGVTVDGKRMLYRGEPATPAVLLVNGAEATIGTVVNAGDQVQFTPARAGQDASMTLEDLLGEHYDGGYVLLNNKEMPLDTPLRNHDVILTLEAPAQPRTQRNNGFMPVAEESAGKKAEVRSPIAESVQPTENRAEAESVQPMQEEPQVQAVKQSAEAMPTSDTGRKSLIRTFNAPLEILLNDEPLVLPPKEDGQPYYLMDLLTHSGIDFDHLDRPIRLAVNGVESGFQQIIRTDDSVEIRCI